MDSAFRRLIRRFSPAEHDRHSEKISVGAFGKHPGWDDHIDDIGLDTDVLIAAKRQLYVQGIGGNVDSGRWDKLEDNHLTEGFARDIFWHMGGRLIAGRMWPSRDGRGRKRYPFVVCVECWRLPIQWIIQSVLPKLEEIRRACAATDSANDVRLVIQSARQELRQSARQCESPPGPAVVSPDALSRLAERKELGPGREGLFRILYHIDREVGQLSPGAAKGKTPGSALLRLPICPNTVFEDVFLWTSFLFARFGTSTSILVLVPMAGDGWIDLIIGEPTESQLFCLQASTQVVPLTNSIPYNISPEFVKHASELIHDSHCPKHSH